MLRYIEVKDQLISRTGLSDNNRLAIGTIHVHRRLLGQTNLKRIINTIFIHVCTKIIHMHQNKASITNSAFRSIILYFSNLSNSFPWAAMALRRLCSSSVSASGAAGVRNGRSNAELVENREVNFKNLASVATPS